MKTVILKFATNRPLGDILAAVEMLNVKDLDLKVAEVDNSGSKTETAEPTKQTRRSGKPRRKTEDNPVYQDHRVVWKRDSQDRPRLDIDKTLANMGLTVEQLFGMKTKFGSLEHGLKAAFGRRKTLEAKKKHVLR